MIHILILIALGLATYLFHNYQSFHEAYLRPGVVEQVNFNREANPQALCDLLAEDAVVVIKDQYTRYKYDINGGKSAACTYFLESAMHFKKPQKSQNGYIEDKLENYSVDHADLFKDYADVTFSTNVNGSVPDLISKGGDILIGKTTTKITVKIPLFKEAKITYYEFDRKLTQKLDNN